MDGNSDWFIWFWILVALLILSFSVCAVSTIYSCCQCPRSSQRPEQRNFACCLCCNRNPVNGPYQSLDSGAEWPSGCSQHNNQYPRPSVHSAAEKARVKAMMPHCAIKKYSGKKFNRLLGVASKCNNDVCPVCIEAFVEGAHVVICPCKHGYHLGCIEGWLKQKGICPLCRKPIPNEYSEASPLLYAFV